MKGAWILYDRHTHFDGRTMALLFLVLLVLGSVWITVSRESAFDTGILHSPSLGRIPCLFTMYFRPLLPLDLGEGQTEIHDQETPGFCISFSPLMNVHFDRVQPTLISVLHSYSTQISSVINNPSQSDPPYRTLNLLTYHPSKHPSKHPTSQSTTQLRSLLSPTTSPAISPWSANLPHLYTF